jgi:hypothetical protein
MLEEQQQGMPNAHVVDCTEMEDTVPRTWLRWNLSKSYEMIQTVWHFGFWQ